MNDRIAKDALPFRASWRTIAAAVVSAALISFMVSYVVRGKREGASEGKGSVRIDCSTGSKAKRKEKKKKGMLERARSNPVLDLALELAKLEVANRLDLKSFRASLRKRRIHINLLLITRTADARADWLNGFSRLLELLSLAALLLLLGPLWVYLRVGDEPERKRVALGSIPYFVIATAAVLIVANALVSIVVGIQKVQVSLAAFGAPGVAVTDAVMHYVIYTDDHEFLELAALLAQARDALRQNPILAIGLLDFLWRGLQVLHESAVLAWTRTGLSIVARLMDLYGPIIAAAAMVLVYQVVVPVIRNLARYPVQVLVGEQEPGIWSFIKDQLRVVWREFKTSFWMFFFILLFTAVAVVLVRLLTFPMVVVCIKTILAIKGLLMGGLELPMAGTVLGMASVAVFLILVFGLCLLPMGVLLSKAYFVVRTRIYEKRRYSEFPLFWRVVRRTLSGVVGLTALSAGLITAAYFLLVLLVKNPAARIWLSAPLFAPVLSVALWRLGVFRRMVELFRVDPLAVEPALPPATDDEKALDPDEENNSNVNVQKGQDDRKAHGTDENHD